MSVLWRKIGQSLQYTCGVVENLVTLPHESIGMKATAVVVHMSTVWRDKRWSMRTNYTYEHVRFLWIAMK
jgi:hypothetical protein